MINEIKERRQVETESSHRRTVGSCDSEGRQNDNQFWGSQILASVRYVRQSHPMSSLVSQKAAIYRRGLVYFKNVNEPLLHLLYMLESSICLFCSSYPFVHWQMTQKARAFVPTAWDDSNHLLVLFNGFATYYLSCTVALLDRARWNIDFRIISFMILLQYCSRRAVSHQLLALLTSWSLLPC